MRVLLSLGVPLFACSFEAASIPDATEMPPSDASSETSSDAPSDAAADAGVRLNLVASANGGTLDSFTSQYCTPSNPPGDCMPGYWLSSNIHDGAYAIGLNPTARSAGWCSGQKPSETPEEFVFSFVDGGNAEVDRVLVQNWGENAGYYTTHLVVYGQAPDASSWNVLLDTALATNETPQVFDLASAVIVSKLRFALTDGQNNQYWEIGELEAWGYLH